MHSTASFLSPLQFVLLIHTFSQFYYTIFLQKNYKISVFCRQKEKIPSDQSSDGIKILQLDFIVNRFASGIFRTGRGHLAFSQGLHQKMIQKIHAAGVVLLSGPFYRSLCSQVSPAKIRSSTSSNTTLFSVIILSASFLF
jgi:hypothetical protein